MTSKTCRRNQVGIEYPANRLNKLLRKELHIKDNFTLNVLYSEALSCLLVPILSSTSGVIPGYSCCKKD